MAGYKYTIEDINTVISERHPDSKWTALSFSGFRTYKLKNGNEKKFPTVLFRCVCGKEKILLSQMVLNGNSKGCICYKRQPRMNMRSPYPLKLRRVYYKMMARCYTPSETRYKNWGGMGVTVCKEWRDDINAFCQWAIRNGWRKGVQLDKDKIGNGKIYSPGVCCFISSKENNRHRRTTKRFRYKDKMLTLGEVSEITGVTMHTLWHRINKRGMSVTKAVSKPVRKIKKR